MSIRHTGQEPLIGTGYFKILRGNGWGDLQIDPTRFEHKRSTRILMQRCNIQMGAMGIAAIPERYVV